MQPDTPAYRSRGGVRAWLTAACGVAGSGRISRKVAPLPTAVSSFEAAAVLYGDHRGDGQTEARAVLIEGSGAGGAVKAFEHPACVRLGETRRWSVTSRTAADGSSLYDHVGLGFTLLDLGGVADRPGRPTGPGRGRRVWSWPGRRECGRYTSFTVNDRPTTARLIVEHPDEHFADRIGGHGVLYKSLASGSFTDKGDDPTDYVEDFKQITQIGGQDLQPVIDLVRWVLKERFLASKAFTAAYDQAYRELYQKIYAGGAATKALDSALAVLATVDGYDQKAGTDEATKLRTLIQQRNVFIAKNKTITGS